MRLTGAPASLHPHPRDGLRHEAGPGDHFETGGRHLDGHGHELTPLEREYFAPPHPRGRIELDFAKQLRGDEHRVGGFESYLTDVGALTGSESANGTFAQSGNVYRLWTNSLQHLRDDVPGAPLP